MSDPMVAFWTGLLLRMAITAIVVVVASIVVERSGPFLGALTASLPIPAGGAYIILATEQDAAFIANAAIGSLGATAVTAVYGLIYAKLAQRHGLLLSLSAALGYWIVGTYVVHLFPWTIGAVLLFNALVTPVTLVLSRPMRNLAEPPVRKAIRRSDILLRALTVTLFITAVTIINHWLGAFGAGMFSVFPAIMTSLMIILHPRIGGPATASVMSHLQVSIIGLTFGIIAIYFGVTLIGVWPALGLGLVTSVGWNAILLLVEQRADRRRHAAART